MCPVFQINPWYLLNVGGMKQSKGVLGVFPNLTLTLTHTQWAHSGEIYFAMAPTVTQKHRLIFILRVIYVYQGPRWVLDPCVGFRLRFPSGPGAPQGHKTVLVIV